MMTVCYEEGVLQAYLDGEVAGSEKQSIEEHISGCSTCCKKLEALKNNQVFATEQLAEYMNAVAATEVNTAEAWKKFSKERLKVSGSRTFMDKIMAFFARSKATAAAAVIVLTLTVAFSFGSVRTAASELLTIFKLEKVQIVNISPEDIALIEKAIRDGAGQVDIENFGRFEYLSHERSGVVTPDDARKAVDFPLKLPAALPGVYRFQDYYKISGGTLNLTLNTDSSNSVLKSLGSKKLLPDQLNGKTFSVTIPNIINLYYNGPDNNRIIISQGRSPELRAAGMDVAAVRDALLALPFLPDNLRSQLSAVNDWQHTLLVPNLAGTSREVSVAGSQGVFFTNTEGAGRNNFHGFANSLLWQRDGVVYAVSGPLSLEQALDVALSMR